MGHVMKGCLTRPRDDIKSDGSRIEGTHKGWNGLSRAFASGLPIMVTLGHDYVHRRNIRILFNQPQPKPFIKTTFGSHHLSLVNSNAKLWNKLPGVFAEDERPTLRIVESGETFGLVQEIRLTKAAKKKAPTLKEEELDDEDSEDAELVLVEDNELTEWELLREDGAPPTPEPGFTEVDGSEPVQALASPQQQADEVHANTSPRSTASSDLYETTGASASSPAVDAVAAVSNEDLAVDDLEMEFEGLFSGFQAGSEGDASVGDEEIRVQEKEREDGRGRKENPRLHRNRLRWSQSVKVDPSTPQPPQPQSPPRLSQSQQVFLSGTGINPLSLSISIDKEFRLFMEMRIEEHWRSDMTPAKLQEATMLYNRRLREKLGNAAVAKQQRAFKEKLISIERILLAKKASGDMTSELKPGLRRLYLPY